jgi:hypothetical protein
MGSPGSHCQTSKQVAYTKICSFCGWVIGHAYHHQSAHEKGQRPCMHSTRVHLYHTELASSLAHQRAQTYMRFLPDDYALRRDLELCIYISCMQFTPTQRFRIIYMYISCVQFTNYPVIWNYIVYVDSSHAIYLQPRSNNILYLSFSHATCLGLWSRFACLHSTHGNLSLNRARNRRQLSISFFCTEEVHI